MANYLGMFSADPYDDSVRRQQAMQLAQMSPGAQVGYGMIRGAQRQGEALGGIVRGVGGALTGQDLRTNQERAMQVRAQLQRELQGIDPSDIDQFYPILIRVLQQNGMIAEATQAAREYEELRLKNEDRALRRKDIERKERADAVNKTWLEAKAGALSKGDPLEMVKAYGEITEKLESGEVTDPVERAKLQAMLRGLAGKLGVKPEKVNNVWQVKIQQGTDQEPARMVEYNTVTGETKVTPLSERVPGKRGKPLQQSIAQDMGAARADILTLAELAQTFRPGFSGGPLAKGASVLGVENFYLTLQRMLGNNPGAADWWNKYSQLITNIRHKYFGSALTASETGAFNQIKALIGQDGSSVLRTLKNQASTAFNNMEAEIKSLEGSADVAAQQAEHQRAGEALKAMPTQAAWQQVNARSRAGQPQRDNDRQKVLQDELAGAEAEGRTADAEAIRREIGARAPTSQAASKTRRRYNPATGNLE